MKHGKRNTALGVERYTIFAPSFKARTMVTGAQNGGRQKSYEEAEAMGIKIQKEWMSAKDNRVRDSHAQLNGVRVRYNKTFPNGCRYPGDPSGRPEEVYNCRCTMVAITPNASQKKRTGNTVASYKKWKNQKENDKKVDYMSNSFRPRYGDFEKLNLEGIEINVNKVTNSQFNMVADVNNRRNKAIKLTEKMLREVKKSLPKNFQIPRIVVIDFERYGLNNKAIGGYHNKSGDLYLNSKYDTKQKILDFVNKYEGNFANKTEYAPMLHELGHKVYYDAIKNFTEKKNISYNEAKKRLDLEIMKLIEKEYDGNIKDIVSMYADDGYIKGEYTEVIAECFSANSFNENAHYIISILKEE